MVTHNIEHSRQLEAEFKQAARVVDRFRAQRGRLPDQDETAQHLSIDGPYIIEPGDRHFEEATSELGQPPEGGYVLGLWRGEWMEYYASWSGATTMPFDESAYYLTGSRAGDCLLGAFGMTICLAAALRICRGRGRR